MTSTPGAVSSPLPVLPEPATRARPAVATPDAFAELLTRADRTPEPVAHRDEQVATRAGSRPVSRTSARPHPAAPRTRTAPHDRVETARRRRSPAPAPAPEPAPVPVQDVQAVDRLHGLGATAPPVPPVTLHAGPTGVSGVAPRGAGPDPTADPATGAGTGAGSVVSGSAPAAAPAATAGLLATGAAVAPAAAAPPVPPAPVAAAPAPNDAPAPAAATGAPTGDLLPVDLLATVPPAAVTAGPTDVPPAAGPLAVELAGPAGTDRTTDPAAPAAPAATPAPVPPAVGATPLPAGDPAGPAGAAPPLVATELAAAQPGPATGTAPTADGPRRPVELLDGPADDVARAVPTAPTPAPAAATPAPPAGPADGAGTPAAPAPAPTDASAGSSADAPPTVPTPLPTPAPTAPTLHSTAASAPETADAVAVDAAPTAGPTGAPAGLPVPGTLLAAAPAPTRDARTVRNVQPALLELAKGLSASGPGHATLVVRLDPPELGPVLVRVVLRGGAVSVTCRSADAGAVGVLQGQHRDVQEALRREGFDLAGFDVRQQSATPGGETPPRDTPGQQSDAGSARRDQLRAARLHRGTETGTPATTPTLRRGTPAGASDSTWL